MSRAISTSKPENKADLTRDTFNPAKQFLRVLYQQGRVQLDADFNEQTSILLHYLQSLAADLIGSYGIPSDINLENIKVTQGDITIKDGKIIESIQIPSGWRYYIDGILCEIDNVVENRKRISRKLSNWNGDSLKIPCLLYIDVWEKTVTQIEDESFHEVALGHSDTTARSKIVWSIGGFNINASGGKDENTSQVETGDTSESEDEQAFTGHLKDIANKINDKEDENYHSELSGLVYENWNAFVEMLSMNRGELAVRVDSKATHQTPCTLSPEHGYQGYYNQLYRIEIHKTGTYERATFKWSRENGSEVFKICSKDDVCSKDDSNKTITLDNVTTANLSCLSKGTFVEIFDKNPEINPAPRSLLKIEERDGRTLHFSTQDMSFLSSLSHPLMLRVWHHTEKSSLTFKDGAIPIPKPGEEIKLESGISIRFQHSPGTVFHAGDYWLIPARSSTGTIDWPESNGKATFCPPHGIQHHYAPLVLLVDSEEEPIECRKQFKNLVGC